MITSDFNVADLPAYGAASAASTLSEHELLTVFKLLSDKTRLRIVLYLVRERELHVSALCTRLAQSQPAVSHHLSLLKDAGLIEVRRQGKYNFYSLYRSQIRRVVTALLNVVDDQTPAPRANEFLVAGYSV